MIKILFTIGSFGVGGKERQLSELIKNLPKDNFECHLFMKNEVGHFFNEIKGYLCSFNNLNSANFKLKDIITLNKYIKIIKPDIIYSFSNVTSYYSYLIKKIRFTSYKLIDGSIRDSRYAQSIRESLIFHLHSLFENVVANTEAGLKARYQNNKKNRFILYNGINTNIIPKDSKKYLRKKLELPYDTKIIIMVSSLRKCFSKNPFRFLELANLICKYDNNYLFLLIGEGQLKGEINIKVVEYKLEQKFLLLGNKSNVLEYFKASDLSVLFSKTEGISNSIMEAMACGIPVLTSSTGGTLEIIKSGKNGFILEDDLIQFYEKIQQLNTDNEYYNQISSNALLTIDLKFSTSKMIENFNNIIGKIINEKKNFLKK